MGIFTSPVLKFAKAADKEYLYAFCTKSTGQLYKNFSQECIQKIYWYSLNEKYIRYFGDETFKSTKWTEISKEGGRYTLKKDVQYKKLKLSSSLTLDVASSYSEEWVIEKQDGGFKVIDITL